jgi:hypothetical protein
MNNDSKIMKLSSLVEQKRAELGKQPRFSPKTTCMLKFDFKLDTNINTINSLAAANEALMLLGLYKTATENVGLTPEEVVINGFSLADWIGDVQSKKEQLIYKKKEKELTDIEKQLNEMLSDDKKTELRLSSIEDILNTEI